MRRFGTPSICSEVRTPHPNPLPSGEREFVEPASAESHGKLSRSRGASRRPSFLGARSANGSRAGKIRSREARNRFGPRKGQGWCLPFVRPLSFARSKLQDINEGSGTPANAGSPTAASCDAARALLERARLPAFHHGSHLRELFHPKGSASGQASWDAVCTALPAFACPSPGMHLPPRSSCRGTDTQAAREQRAKPLAGTAPAPPFGLPPEGVLRRAG